MSRRKTSRNKAWPRRRMVKEPKLFGPTTVFHRVDTITLPKVASDSGNALWKTLSDFASSDIVSLYSMYKITNVKLTFRLVNAPNNNATFPTLWIAPRQYSTVAPTSLDEVQQYNGVRSFQFGPNNVSYTQNFKPAVTTITKTNGTAKEGLTFPGSEHYISTDNDIATYIFAVYWLQRYSSGTDPTHTIELDYDITLSCKAPR